MGRCRAVVPATTRRVSAGVGRAAGVRGRRGSLVAQHWGQQQEKEKSNGGRGGGGARWWRAAAGGGALDRCLLLPLNNAQ